jgi:hypothetical protein
VTGCCERGNELSGFTKGGEFLDQLSDKKLVKKVSAPWNMLPVYVGWKSNSTNKS